MKNVPHQTSVSNAALILASDEEFARHEAQLEHLLFKDPDFAAASEATMAATVETLVDLDALARRWRMTGPKCDPVARRELERRAAERAARESMSFSQARRVVKREALERALFLLAEAPTQSAAGRISRAMLLRDAPTKEEMKQAILSAAARWLERSVKRLAEDDLRAEARRETALRATLPGPSQDPLEALVAEDDHGRRLAEMLGRLRQRRERECLLLLDRGLSRAEIAAQMELNVARVDVYLHRIRKAATVTTQ